MSKIRAQVRQPNGPFEIVEPEIPEPGTGSVRVKFGGSDHVVGVT